MKIFNIFVNHEYDTAKCHELVLAKTGGSDNILKKLDGGEKGGGVKRFGDGRGGVKFW